MNLAALKEEAKQRFPWWSPVRESFRNVVALVLFVGVFMPIYNFVDVDGQGFIEAFRRAMLTYLYAFPVYYAAYGLMVFLPLRRLDADDLTLVAALDSGEVPSWRRWSSSGGQWGGTVATLAIVLVLYVAATPNLRTDPLVLGVTAIHLASGWFCMLMSYALTYTRQHLIEGGVRFPEEEGASPTARVFSDYIYLSQQIQTTFGASDVAITSTAFRRTVNLHNLLSFAFNTIIVSLMVSLLLINASA
ncbi:DUF1345 domain-containing protein [Parenemella sanctibonifatiensis]|nr:DUF1345 domain-containing protein [Parenemella sanctibonifatiensis]